MPGMRMEESQPGFLFLRAGIFLVTFSRGKVMIVAGTAVTGSRFLPDYRMMAGRAALMICL